MKGRVLFLPCRTDAYFAVADVAAEATLLPNAKLVIIDSISGHAAGFGRAGEDRKQINQAIATFVGNE